VKDRILELLAKKPMSKAQLAVELRARTGIRARRLKDTLYRLRTNDLIWLMLKLDHRWALPDFDYCPRCERGWTIETVRSRTIDGRLLRVPEACATCEGRGWIKTGEGTVP